MTNKIDPEFDDTEAEAARLDAELAQRPLSSGLPIDDVRKQFKAVIRAHVGCTSPTMFIRRADKAMVSTAAFNIEYNRLVNQLPELKARYNDAAAKFAIAAPALEIVRGVCFRPDAPAVTDDRRFNMWQPADIEPLAGEPAIFLDHMAYLIPNAAERKLVLDWLAWLMQHPDKKLMFGLLIIGEGGTGKSWLGKLMEVILGESNARLFERDDVVSDNFNAFSENAQLVFLHEVAPEGSKRNVLSLLKGLITESHVWINKKNIERFRIENFANVMGITNHAERVKVLRNDRRWGIVRAVDDVRFVDDDGRETAQTLAYYARLWECIGSPAEPGEEARRVLAWLGARDLSGFNGSGLAPVTDTKEDVAAGREDSVMAQVANMHQGRSGPFGSGVFTAAEVLSHVSVSGSQEDALAEVTRAMVAVGCRRVGLDGQARQVRIGKRRVRLWTVSRRAAERFSRLSVGELKQAFEARSTTAGDWEEDIE